MSFFHLDNDICAGLTHIVGPRALLPSWVSIRNFFFHQPSAETTTLVLDPELPTRAAYPHPHHDQLFWNRINLKKAGLFAVAILITYEVIEMPFDPITTAVITATKRITTACTPPELKWDGVVNPGMILVATPTSIVQFPAEEHRHGLIKNIMVACHQANLAQAHSREKILRWLVIGGAICVVGGAIAFALSRRSTSKKSKKNKKSKREKEESAV